MADTYYAWSPIKVGGKVNPETQMVEDVKVINPGDTVTAKDLGVTDEEFQTEYVAGGVARTVEYPKDVPPQQSVTQYLRDSATAEGYTAETTGGTHLLDAAEQLAVAVAAQKEVENADEVKDEEPTDNAEQKAHMPILEEAPKAAAAKPATAAASS